MRSRIISVSQIAGLDTLIVFTLEDGTEITKQDPEGDVWCNREYYIGKEAGEVDGMWIIFN